MAIIASFIFLCASMEAITELDGNLKKSSSSFEDEATHEAKAPENDAGVKDLLFFFVVLSLLLSSPGIISISAAPKSHLPAHLAGAAAVALCDGVGAPSSVFPAIYRHGGVPVHGGTDAGDPERRVIFSLSFLCCGSVAGHDFNDISVEAGADWQAADRLRHAHLLRRPRQELAAKDDGGGGRRPSEARAPHTQGLRCGWCWRAPRVFPGSHQCSVVNMQRSVCQRLNHSIPDLLDACVGGLLGNVQANACTGRHAPLSRDHEHQCRSYPFWRAPVFLFSSFFFFYFTFLEQADAVHPRATSTTADLTNSSPPGIRRQASFSIAGGEISTHTSVARCALLLGLSRPPFNRRMARSFHPAVLASGDTSAYRRRVRHSLCSCLCCISVGGPSCNTVFSEDLHCNLLA